MSCKMLKKQRQGAALQSTSRDVAWEVDICVFHEWTKRIRPPAVIDESKTAGLLPEPGRCETYLNSLESFLQSDVPEPALNRGK